MVSFGDAWRLCFGGVSETSFRKDALPSGIDRYLASSVDLSSVSMKSWNKHEGRYYGSQFERARSTYLPEARFQEVNEHAAGMNQVPARKRSCSHPKRVRDTSSRVTYSAFLLPPDNIDQQAL